MVGYLLGLGLTCCKNAKKSSGIDRAEGFVIPGKERRSHPLLQKGAFLLCP